MPAMKTYSPSVTKISRDWHLIDANNQVLGRLATHIAELLMGKHKTDFVRHLDIGDHVVVINAAMIVVTGRKSSQKLYHRHSGWPGGMTITTFAQMQSAHPDRIIIHAVSGMLPKNKLHDRLLSHLHVYPTSDHPYVKQFKTKN
jgi:large subunit ribosomal protein L13